MSGKVSGIRNVKITFTVASFAPLDFYKAATKLVEEIEFKYAQDSTSVADITGVTTIAAGKLPGKSFSVRVTTVVATGTYTVEYLGVVTNMP